MRRLLLIAVTVVLSGCGFHLRGSYTLPFDTLFINQPETAELRAVLKRNIEASTATRVVNEAKDAQASLTVLNDVPAKIVLSLSSAGRVREYQLVRTFVFRIHDAANRDLMPIGKIVIRRDISFNDDLVLSKEAEEALLWRDIQNDLVQQLLRRIAAAKAAPTEEE
ncbi:MAG: LPS assembly lipoprotein LptE [Rhodocyclaceae bacterium]|nr:LPS assembly lipoprotein LptE [Rhodocyclaceae bacterium]